jgi:hypothetical protein
MGDLMMMTTQVIGNGPVAGVFGALSGTSLQLSDISSHFKGITH